MKNCKNILVLFFAFFYSVLYGQDSNEYLSKGVVKDFSTKQNLTSATVTYIGTDSSRRVLTVDSLGEYTIVLKRNTAYAIIASAPGYLNAKAKEVGPHGPMITHSTFELEKIKNCSGLIPLFIYNTNESSNPFVPDEPEIKPFEIIEKIMQDNPKLKAELIGYRDQSEKPEISLKRSKEAVKTLINLGIDEKRLLIKDGGKSNEITQGKRDSDLNNTGIQHNRMLIFNILEL